MSKHVVIIGAGVIGLSAAVELASKTQHTVTVVARDLPGDWKIEYASPRAGAHFRPTPVRTDAEVFENKLMHETYDRLKTIAKEDPSSAVDFVPALEYFDKELSEDDVTMFAAWPGYRALNSSELPLDSVKAGLTYSAWVLNSPAYLAWLQKQAESHGVKFIKGALSAVAEAVHVAKAERPGSAAADVIVNASGMGFGDADCFPSRGQFVLVSNTYDKTISHHTGDGQTTVVIPRPGGGTVVGSTKEPYNWSPHNSPAAAQGILRRVEAVCPGLCAGSSKLDVQETYVGRRPMRKGGMRLEKAELEIAETADDGFTNEKRTVKVVHCYGAGPSGYKISWGVGRCVREMVGG